MNSTAAALIAKANAETPTPKVAALQSLRDVVSADMPAVDALILENLQCDEPVIAEVGAHILKAGGKRLRPSLTLAAAKLFDYSGARHVKLAACVELIHTATLLHDDVVDESHLRRGRATANDVWGNQTSVLVGDFLLSRAFQLMVSDGELKVLKILSDVSAIIAEGEVMQLAAAKRLETTEDTYMRVVGAKTAALFAAACELGAVINAQEPWEAPLREFGMKLGVAFQMMDDALDYKADEGETGKALGDDFREGKMTLPIIYALKAANAEEKAFFSRTMVELEQTDEDFATAQYILEKYHAIDATLTHAKQVVEDAKALLAPLPASAAKTALLDVADFAVARAY